VRFCRGQLIKPLAEYRLRRNGFDAKGIGEEFIASIEIERSISLKSVRPLQSNPT